VLCNKCGLYERTHQKDRPHDPAELRSKPRKTLHQKLAGPGVPSSPVEGMPRSRLSPNMSPVDRSGMHGTSPVDRPMLSPMDAVPPRPLNTHASLLHMQAQNQGQTLSVSTTAPQGHQIMDEPMRDESRHAGGYNSFVHPSASQSPHEQRQKESPPLRSGHPHSLGSLLNHPERQSQSQSQSRSDSPGSTHSHPRESPRGNTKDLHLSPVVRSSGSHTSPGYPPAHGRNASGSPASSSPRSATSAIDVDKEYRYEHEKQRNSPPIATLEQEAMNRDRQRERERGT